MLKNNKGISLIKEFGKKGRTRTEDAIVTVVVLGILTTFSSVTKVQQIGMRAK